MDRRSFINKAGKYSVAGMVASSFACKQAGDAADSAGEMVSDVAETLTGDNSLSKIGVQLYSLRSITDNNFPDILEQVAGAGYQELEFAGYHGHSADELRGVLEKLNLDPVSTHVSVDDLSKDMDGIIKYAADLGIDYVTCPWVSEDHRSAEGYTALGAMFNRAGEACKEKGMQFAYHNHEFEFIEYDGKAGYDILIDACDSELVKQELDLYWITFAGKDPLAYFEKYPGLFHLCHVKDMSGIGGAQEMASVGSGEIDFGKIFANPDSGLKHFIVEHDNPEDPMASITSSINHLRELRF